MHQLLAEFRDLLENQLPASHTHNLNYATLRYRYSQQFGDLSRLTAIILSKLNDLDPSDNELWEMVITFIDSLEYIEGDIDNSDSTIQEPHPLNYREIEDNSIPPVTHESSHLKYDVSHRAEEPVHKIRKIEIPKPLSLQLK